MAEEKIITEENMEKAFVQASRDQSLEHDEPLPFGESVLLESHRLTIPEMGGMVLCSRTDSLHIMRDSPSSADREMPEDRGVFFIPEGLPEEPAKVGQLLRDTIKRLGEETAPFQAGSTLTSVVLWKEYVLAGQVGDSRAYLVHVGGDNQVSVERLTTTHTYAPGQEEEYWRILENGGLFSVAPGDVSGQVRLNGLLAVTRSLGHAAKYYYRIEIVESDEPLLFDKEEARGRTIFHHLNGQWRCKPIDQDCFMSLSSEDMLKIKALMEKERGVFEESQEASFAKEKERENAAGASASSAELDAINRKKNALIEGKRAIFRNAREAVIQALSQVKKISYDGDEPYEETVDYSGKIELAEAFASVLRYASHNPYQGLTDEPDVSYRRLPEDAKALWLVVVSDGFTDSANEWTIKRVVKALLAEKGKVGSTERGYRFGASMSFFPSAHGSTMTEELGRRLQAVIDQRFSADDHTLIVVPVIQNHRRNLALQKAVFAVADGHDGSRASEHIYRSFQVRFQEEYVRYLEEKQKLSSEFDRAGVVQGHSGKKQR